MGRVPRVVCREERIDSAGKPAKQNRRFGNRTGMARTGNGPDALERPPWCGESRGGTGRSGGLLPDDELDLGPVALFLIFVLGFRSIGLGGVEQAPAGISAGEKSWERRGSSRSLSRDGWSPHGDRRPNPRMGTSRGRVPGQRVPRTPERAPGRSSRRDRFWWSRSMIPPPHSGPPYSVSFPFGFGSMARGGTIDANPHRNGILSRSTPEPSGLSAFLIAESPSFPLNYRKLSLSLILLDPATGRPRDSFRG